MKSTIKVALTIALLVSTTFADGDMGTGGFADDANTGGKNQCAENCLTPEPATAGEEINEADESILSLIRDYLNSLFA